MMADPPVPDHRATVEAVAAQYPDLLALNTRASCALFEQHVIAALPPGEAWGFIAKDGGENGYTWPNGVRTGVDVIAMRDPLRQVDIITAAGAMDDPDPANRVPGSVEWRVIDPAEYRPANVWTDPAAVATYAAGPHGCLLGATWFWIMAGFKYWPDQVQHNLDWFAANMPIDYVRALAVVGGDLFLATDGSYQDPWVYAGSWLAWPDHGAIMANVTDALYDRGIKTQWTVIGGLAQIPTAAHQDAMIDHVAACLKGREHKIECVEIMNEYRVNKGDIALLQRLATRLRGVLPRLERIALSAPHAGCGSVPVLQDEVEAMYASCPAATAITPHWCRSAFLPPDLGPAAPAIRYCNEPRGPGASTGGDVTDPAVLAQDYQMAIAAGYAGYVFHSNWGVYDHHLHEGFMTPTKGVWTHVYEHANMDQIAIALAEVRAGLAPSPSPIPPDVVPPIDVGATWQLLAGESLRGDGMLEAANKQFRLILQLDGNLVIYGPPDGTGLPTWDAGTAGESVGSLAMQADGNLVLYDADGIALRASHTDGHEGAMLQLNDDGRLVVYADPHGPDAGLALADVTAQFWS